MEYFSIMNYTGNSTPLCETQIDKNNDICEIKYTQKPEGSGIHTKAVISVKKNHLKKAALRLVIEESSWNIDNYVFAPAALYNGNRFHSLHKEYPPMLTKEEAKKYTKETVISDIPRMNINGISCVQLNAGDLSVPCIGYYSHKKKSGWLLFFEQKNELGNLGVTIQENAVSGMASFILSSPCVRTPNKYRMCSTSQKTDDTAAVLNAGDTVTFSFTQYRFECSSICEFLNTFFKLREMQKLPKSHPNHLPWSRAFEIIEEKYNRRNWVKAYGFYKSSEAENGIYRQWQTGWVGGGINTLPGLILGNSETKEKSRRTLDFLFDKLQHKSGFLYGVFCDGRTYGDNFLHPENPNIVMSRKNADALYYTVKQLIFLSNNGCDIPALWRNGLLRLADAFVTYFMNNGEISQFIDLKNGKPYISGSASAGLVCAGLALCALYFENNDYLKIAENIAENYYRDFISKGISTGGPGEILSCPDSESSFALLESFVTLYRFTEKEKWLEYAKDTASLCASWCVGYDYTFESDTQFSERGVASTGAVWASVQNKHAAPGICTMSGESLLHLYRATEDPIYLELLKDISHNITQYLSTEENPLYASYVWHNKPAHRQKLFNRHIAHTVHSLSKTSKTAKKALAPLYSKIFNPAGRMNERVNLSDWEGKSNVGEVPLGSCWCEVSAMLTYLEIPAIYIQPDTCFCFTLDHVACCIKNKTDESFTAVIHNPTGYDANYRICIDSYKKSKKILPPDKMLSFKNVFLPSGESIELKISRR